MRQWPYYVIHCLANFKVYLTGMFLLLEFQLFQSGLNAILRGSEYVYIAFESGISPLSLL